MSVKKCIKPPFARARLFTPPPAPHLTLSQTTEFRLSKLKEFADDNFRFDENSRKFFKRVGNTAGKRETARYEQFLFFPQCFRKTCGADT